MPHGVLPTWGLPKIRGPILVVPIIRTIIYLYGCFQKIRGPLFGSPYNKDQNMGDSKNQGPLFGSLMIRALIFWGPYQGPLLLETIWGLP